MRVFLSYAHEQKKLAGALATTLLAEGHTVFFDGAALVPGAHFDKIIRSEVARADMFVFFVSPESVEPGSYARTELRFAMERWPRVTGRILPVLVTKVPQVPPDLRFTMLEPEGDIVAEVARAVESLGSALARRRMLKAAALASAVAVLAFVLVAWGRAASPVPPAVASVSAALPSGATAAAGSAPLFSSASAAPPAASVAIPAGAPKLRAIDLAVGHSLVCAVRSDRRVVCWAGDDPSAKWVAGQIDPTLPRLVPGLEDALQVAGDDGQWCARVQSGAVFCWADPTQEAKPIAISGAVEIASGCARLGDGKVVCWHDGAPKAVRGISDAISIGRTSGGSYCMVRRDRTVACWGGNTYGQLGDGTTTEREEPVAVKGIAGADQVAGSLFYGSCALLAWKVHCWGGEQTKSFEPQEQPGISDAVQVELAEYHGCVRLSDARVACWGFNSSGQLGYPTKPDELQELDPKIVPSLSNVVDVRVGGGEPCGGCGSTCVRTMDGAVSCWGALMRSDKPVTLNLHTP